MKRHNIILANISSLEAEPTSVNNKLEYDNIFHLIVEISPYFTAIVQDEKFVYVNAKGKSLLKCDNSCEIIGKSIYEFIDPNFRAIVKELYSKEVYYEDINNPLYIKAITVDGDPICFETSSKPFIYNNNNGVLIIARDISSELKQKQKLDGEKSLKGVVLNSFSELIAFSESNHRIRWMNDAVPQNCGITVDSYTRDIPEYKQLIELLKKKQKNLEEAQRIGKIGSWELDASLDINDRSDEICRIYELNPLNTSPSPEEYLTIIHPDDRAKVILAHKDSLKSKKPYTIDYRLLFADGRIKYVSENCETFCDESGNLLRSVGILQDKTESRQAEDLLRIREQEFRTLVENSPDIVIRYDKNCNRTYVNPAFLKISGYSESEMKEKSAAQLSPLPSHIALEYHNMIKKVIDTSQPQTIELHWPRPDGDLWHSIKAVPEFDKDGDVVSVLALSRDLTEIENSRQQSEVLSFALDSASEAVFIRREKTINFSYVNGQACSSLGYSREELLEMTMFDIDSDITSDILNIISADIASGKTSIIETRHKRKDGTIFPVEITNTRYMYNDKTYIMNVVQDITERKEKQLALIKAEEKLKESKQRYREVFDNSNDGICLLEVLENSHFCLLAINTRYERDLNIKNDQCMGLTLAEIVSPETAFQMNAQFQRCIDAGSSIVDKIELDMPIIGKRTYQTTLIPIHDIGGEIYRIMCVSRDITCNLIKERELEKSRNLLDNAEVVAAMGHFYMDFLNGNFNCSRGVYEILGEPFDENVVGNLDIFKFIHPNDTQRVKKTFDYSVENKTKFNEKYRIVNRNGVEKVIHTVCSFVTDFQNNEQLFGNIQDISDLSALKNQVLLGDEKMRILVENSPMGMLIISGRIPIFINQALFQLAGVTSIAEFIKINPIDLVHPDDRRYVIKLTDKLFSEENEVASTYQLTLRGVEQNGRVKIYDVRFVSCLLDGSKYLQITVIDITDEIEREKLTSQLASDSLYINQKNSTILSIKHELEEIIKVKCNWCDKSGNGTDFRNILRVLDSYSDTDGNWGLFKKHFENLHPEFIQNLNIICPTLTAYDIKHCACIRLGFDTKEIATFFNVTPASIQKSRFRLKRKLNLPQNVDLREFIMCV
jgi:PAS domain S-box-containing protein